MSTEDGLPDYQAYYDGYENGRGWNLGVMVSALEQMSLDSQLEPLQAVPKANMLVLGSATPENLGHIAVIDRILRPGQGMQDTVLIIDRNQNPLKKHLEEWRHIEFTARGEKDHGLPYPDFLFAQADMRALPVKSKTADVVISDYTLNFVSNLEDIQTTFAEASRVMKPGALMLLAVAGHERVDPNLPVSTVQDVPPQRKERFGGLVTYQFPLQSYMRAAAKSGLNLVASHDSVGNDMLCAVLRKSAKISSK